jgi:hypothetical protein
MSTFSEVSFSDGITFKIPSEIFNKYTTLQKPFIFRSSERFKDTILAILQGESLRGKKFDIKSELDDLIDEILFYGIIHTDQQIINISESCGLIDKIMKIKTFINNKTSSKGVLKNSVQKRIVSFSTQWSLLIQPITDSLTNKNSQSLQASSLLTFILSTDDLSLSRFNMLNQNILYVFLDKFIDNVIEHNNQSFNNFTLKFTLNLNTSCITGVNQLSTGTTDGNSLLSKGINAISSLLGVNTNSVPTAPTAPAYYPKLS